MCLSNPIINMTNCPVCNKEIKIDDNGFISCNSDFINRTIDHQFWGSKDETQDYYVIRKKISGECIVAITVYFSLNKKDLSYTDVYYIHYDNGEWNYHNICEINKIMDISETLKYLDFIFNNHIFI
jgi:hypothetical protein